MYVSVHDLVWNAVVGVASRIDTWAQCTPGGVRMVVHTHHETPDIGPQAWVAAEAPSDDYRVLSYARDEDGVTVEVPGVPIPVFPAVLGPWIEAHGGLTPIQWPDGRLGGICGGGAEAPMCLVVAYVEALTEGTGVRYDGRPGRAGDLS